ncbi:(2Fe-2S)-binding protein [Rhodococcus sp. X156]|uniref:(2Fe-2S)-binding protein n=1 Tax=Rhodococcus sp. X156 TaxID=2499145 RepID=UPI000FDC8B6A|nr:(2Fe-2S)-binding protein [Rhodococcus sp. X156]
MFVCICHAVTETDVELVIENGASTEEEVGERCYAGTGCGSCLDRICDLIDAGTRRERMLLKLAG